MRPGEIGWDETFALSPEVAHVNGGYFYNAALQCPRERHAILTGSRRNSTIRVSSYGRCRFPAASNRGEGGTRRCDLMPNVAICVYCSQKIEEKEKSINVPHLPGGVAHLACALKVTIRTAPRR